MYDNKTFLAVIPARGGSKRLPRKNVLELKGKPLINWSIEAALNSKYIDKVIVSSDDQEILATAQNAGAEVLPRPAELAGDTSTIADTINYVLEHTPSYDYIVLLQPTSPLRNEHHIDNAIELLINRNADGIVSVCENEHSPLWSNTIPPDDSLNNFLRPEVINKQSQELETYYRLNGALYIFSLPRFIADQRIIFQDNIYAYKMDGKFSIDIDTELDFLFAGVLLDLAI